MKRVLIAGRGAIAGRAVASARAAGLSTVAVVAVSDPQQAHALGADAVEYLEGSGPAETYDNAERVAEAAVRCGADLVHPGHGALAEDPGLPALLERAGIGCAGSGPGPLATVGDKSLAVAAAARLDVPVLPHATGRTAIAGLIARVGFPLVLKPRTGRYGQGVRVVRSAAEAERVLATDPHPEAENWYAERYLEDGRVVGVTVAVDREGRVAGLGERESLLIAGHLKLLDAAPVLGTGAELVESMRRDAFRLAGRIGLRGVVTAEFLVSAGRYFFLEVNPRLTGAYRMSELQTGVDVIALQLALAQGRTLDAHTPLVDPAVHCAEARLFVRPGTPRPGRLSGLRLAPASGVTYACALDRTRPVAHDSMLAQVLARAASRDEAVRRAVDAVEASEVSGIRHYGDEIVDWFTHHMAASPR
ncbi:MULTISPECIES: ATP-binding protein [Streptomyces]|uniref:ATP-binding protein n=1 Tax=Streptomyces TaxID=1883 RepID=UPI0016798352|nr:MULTISPECIES: biotin carboxylase N-terminal domain-containing protein [Streptomyces]MBK3525779.1 ATP-grasp domain-containing protein [Streptomyces sp. MBT70]GGS13739.1 hypothetical protein GCM10010236_80080 [Streptomyces eurythermus]